MHENTLKRIKVYLQRTLIYTDGLKKTQHPKFHVSMAILVKIDLPATGYLCRRHLRLETCFELTKNCCN